MGKLLRRHATTVAVAMITAAVTAGGPSALAAAYDAVNADKVDGRHAVGAAATQAQRAGKLVAANADGRLPNGIIAKAPDAEKLDGIDSAGFLRKTGKAANADKLDGVDSTGFLSATKPFVMTYSRPWLAGTTQTTAIPSRQDNSTSVDRVAGSGATSVTAFTQLDTPTTMFGRPVKLKSVQVCVYTSSATLTLRVKSSKQTDGVYGNQFPLAEATSPGDLDCPTMTVDPAVTVDSMHPLLVEVTAAINADSDQVFLGRVTATYQAQ